MLKKKSNQSLAMLMQEPLLPAARGDVQIRIHVSRNTLIAIICSLIIHALIFFAIPKIAFDTPASAPPVQTIEVSLAQPEQAKSPVPEFPPAEPVKPKKNSPKPAPKVIAKKPAIDTKPVFAVPDSPVVISPVMPPKVQQEPVKENAPTDMMSYVKARQAQRQASESDAARQNADAAAREQGPSEAQMREEKIKRNLQTGTNGIFEITSLSSRHASFAFRGWTNDYSTSRRQFFEVEAATGQDVRLVMIKKMIALIREHYQGDFNWDSQRLARVVVLSARMEDNAGLEDFMMREFFGANYKNT